MSELKLLPCPFCGGEAEIRHNVLWYWGQCKKCNATSKESGSEANAIEIWNTRTPMANIVDKLEALKTGASGCNGVMCENCEYNDICFDGEQSFKIALDKCHQHIKAGD